jgi:hypothetical protein
MNVAQTLTLRQRVTGTIPSGNVYHTLTLESEVTPDVSSVTGAELPEQEESFEQTLVYNVDRTRENDQELGLQQTCFGYVEQ